MTTWMNRRRTALAVVVGVATAGSLGAWWIDRQWNDDSLARVRAAGVLRVGYALEAPYAFVLRDGTVTGESIEVAQAVARGLALGIDCIATEFGRLIPELVRGRFDLIAAGMFVTDERRRRVRFTRPTLIVRAGWLTRAGGPRAPSSYREAGHAGTLRIAVVDDSVEHQVLRETRPPGIALLVVPDAQAGRAAVSRGEADALALSWPTVSRYARESGGTLVAAVVGDAGVPPARVALALRRDDRTLAEAVDGVLAGYIGSAAHVAMLTHLGLQRGDAPQAAR